MISIIDYGVGNLNSIHNILKKVGADSAIITKPEDLDGASKIILPGMGNFDNCMTKFNNSGFRDVIETKVFSEKIPLLGICVGLQMLMNDSEEGNEKGLGWISGKTLKFDQRLIGSALKIPNMGWLDIVVNKISPLTVDLENSRFYFAHSFYVKPDDNETIILSAEYGHQFAVALEKDNIIGVQFHPEKSHRFGMKLISNFVNNYSEKN